MKINLEYTQTYLRKIKLHVHCIQLTVLKLTNDTHPFELIYLNLK